jgi:hypothetical protein
VLSGDAAHFGDNFVNRSVPGFNFNADRSRQSMDRIDAIVKAERAQLWINHDSKQNAPIRHAPKYYRIKFPRGRILLWVGSDQLGIKGYLCAESLGDRGCLFGVPRDSF